MCIALRFNIKWYRRLNRAAKSRQCEKCYEYITKTIVYNKLVFFTANASVFKHKAWFYSIKCSKIIKYKTFEIINNCGQEKLECRSIFYRAIWCSKFFVCEYALCCTFWEMYYVLKFNKYIVGSSHI